MEDLDNQITQARNNVNQYYDNISKGTDKEKIQKLFTGIAFVSLDTELEKDKLITENDISGSLIKRIKRVSKLKWNDNYLFVEQAADPTTVFWENLHVST